MFILILVIARITEIRLRNKYSIKVIQETLREVNCSHMDANHYLFNYANSITDEISDEFKVDIGKKVMSLKEIKKNFGMVKKH